MKKQSDCTAQRWNKSSHANGHTVFVCVCVCVGLNAGSNMNLWDDRCD